MRSIESLFLSLGGHLPLLLSAQMGWAFAESVPETVRIVEAAIQPLSGIGSAARRQSANFCHLRLRRLTTGARSSPDLPFGAVGIMFFEMLAVTTSLGRFLQVLLLTLTVALGATTATAQAASLAVAPEGASEQHIPALEDATDCASRSEGAVAEATCNSISGCPLQGVLTNASPFEPASGIVNLVPAGWSSGSISIDLVTKPPRRTAAA